MRLSRHKGDAKDSAASRVCYIVADCSPVSDPGKSRLAVGVIVEDLWDALPKAGAWRSQRSSEHEPCMPFPGPRVRASVAASLSVPLCSGYSHLVFRSADSRTKSVEFFEDGIG